MEVSSVDIKFNIDDWSQFCIILSIAQSEKLCKLTRPLLMSNIGRGGVGGGVCCRI